MPRKKPKKVEVRKSKTSRNVVLYVENCSSKGKIFSDYKSLLKWVDKFNKKYPAVEYGDNWLNVIITDIKGDIVTLEEGFRIK